MGKRRMKCDACVCWTFPSILQSGLVWRPCGELHVSCSLDDRCQHHLPPTSQGRLPPVQGPRVRGPALARSGVWADGAGYMGLVCGSGDFTSVVITNGFMQIFVLMLLHSFFNCNNDVKLQTELYFGLTDNLELLTQISVNMGVLLCILGTISPFFYSRSVNSSKGSLKVISWFKG